MNQKPDYTKLIDDQTWAFIKKTGEFYPDDAVDASIEQQRSYYNTMCSAFHAGRPENVHVEDKKAEGVSVRIYTEENAQAKAMILYIHGGGYVVGGLESHDDVCVELCNQTGHTVVAVDYRLAPEHKHPNAFDDCLSAYNWSVEEFKLPIILVGDSAGGNLCAGVAHALETKSIKPRGQVLIYPALGGDHTKGSYVEHADAPMLTTKDMAFYEEVRLDTPPANDDASYAPLWASEFSDLPPTLAIAAECDPLADDAETYCKALREAGVPAASVTETGLVHGYLRARHSVDRARVSFSRIVKAIKLMSNGEELDQVALDRLI